MKAHSRRSCLTFLHLLVIAVLLVSIVPSTPQVAYAEPPDGEPNETLDPSSSPPPPIRRSRTGQLMTEEQPQIGLPTLSTETINLAGSCGTSARLPFGSDDEFMLAPINGGHQSYQVVENPTGWKLAEIQSGRWKSIDAINLDVNRVMVAVQGTNNKVYTNIRTEQYGNFWKGWEHLYMTTYSAPALVMRQTGYPTILIRNLNNQLQYKQWKGNNWSETLTIQETEKVVSAPVAVSMNSNHMATFYMHEDGYIRMSEWVSSAGKWSEPIKLTLQLKTDAALAVLSRKDGSIDLAINGAGLGSSTYDFWVYHWTSGSKWAELEPVQVATNITPQSKPAITSRHSNHLLIGYGDVNHNLFYRGGKGKTVDSDQNETDVVEWLPPVNLSTKGAEVTVTPFNPDTTLFLARELNQSRWLDIKIDAKNQASGRATIGQSSTHGAAFSLPTAALVPVVQANNEIILFYPMSTDTNGLYISWMPRSNGVSFREGTSRMVDGRINRHVLGTANGRTYHLSLWNAQAKAKLRMNDVTTGQEITDWWISSDHSHILEGGDPTDIVAADLTGDDNDEVFVVSHNKNKNTLYLTPIELASTGFFLGETWTYPDITFTWPKPRVVTGDFDGDGTKEIVVAAITSWQSIMLAKFAYDKDNHKLILKHSEQIETYGHASVYDIELAAGRFYDRPGTKAPQDQLILANWLEDRTQPVYGYSYGDIQVVHYKHNLDVRVFKWNNRELSQPHEKRYYSEHYEDTPYNTLDIALGQIELDTTEELVIATPMSIYLLDKDTPDLNTTPSNDGARIGRSISFNTGEVPTLAMGDVDQDGLDEIAWASFRKLRIYDYYPTAGLHQTTSTDYMPIDSMVLAGDIDNDSFVAELAGCPERFSEAKVVAVIYEPPVHVDADGNSLHKASASYGIYESGEDQQYHGGRVSGGVSLGVGTEFEQSAPVAGTKIGSVEAMVTYELSVDIGVGWRGTYTVETEHELSSEDGIGAVVVMSSGEFQCITYKLYRRSNPEEASTLMTCGSPSPPILTSYSVENWYTENTKKELSSTWVDIGRSTRLPISKVDTAINTHGGNMIWIKDTPVNVRQDSKSGSAWSMMRSNGNSVVVDGSIGINTVVSAEAVVTGIKTTVAGWVGVAYEWGYEHTWTKGLSFGGSVKGFACATCPQYRYKPYLYQRDVKASSGVVYPIMVLDYTIPEVTDVALQSAALAQSTPAPLAPVITSTTHLREDTWYPTSTLTVAFEQPQSPYEPATVAGYRWSLDSTPGLTPTLEMVETSTHTYNDLKDGVYYLNAQAISEEGYASPVSTRTVRIDTTPPQVAFITDPPAPTGINGWYTDTPVNVTAIISDANGSGIASFDYSTDDGETWQSVSGKRTPPISFAEETGGATLLVRATDNVGLTTNDSITIKIDTTPPSSTDVDGYGLSYGTIITNSMGNEVFVMGGVVNDSLSGRAIFNILPGEQGVWESSLTGDPTPMPPDNMFYSSETSLNWIYTPTYQMRGYYNIYGHSVDNAGNAEAIEPIVEVLWEPEDYPDLSESHVILSRRQTREGTQQPMMTIKLRNSGFQETSVSVVNQLPAGVSMVEKSLSHGAGTASYDSASRQVMWDVPIIWPGTEVLLYFDVEIDPQQTDDMKNRLTLQPYWPGLNESYPYDDIPIADYILEPLVIEASLTEDEDETAVPEIYNAYVWAGQLVTEPDVEIFLDASRNTSAFQLREWTWDIVNEQWQLAQESSWITFVPTYTDKLEVYEDELGRYGWYRWTLSPQDGVKYLSVVVASDDGQQATLAESQLIQTNLMNRSGQALRADEAIQYRFNLNSGNLAIFNLVEFAGDAQAYIWSPRNGLRPDYESVGTDINSEAFSIDLAAFFADEEGTYIVEVHGVEEDTSYRLVPAGDIETSLAQALLSAEGTGEGEHLAWYEQDMRIGAHLTATDAQKLALYEEALRSGTPVQELAATGHDAQLDKWVRRPTRPSTLTTPQLEVSGISRIPSNPKPSVEYNPVYLPLVAR